MCKTPKRVPFLGGLWVALLGGVFFKSPTKHPILKPPKKPLSSGLQSSRLASSCCGSPAQSSTPWEAEEKVWENPWKTPCFGGLLELLERVLLWISSASQVV